MMKSDILVYSAIAITVIICLTVLIVRLFTPALTREPKAAPGTFTGPNAEIMDELQRINKRLDVLEQRITTTSLRTR